LLLDVQPQADYQAASEETMKQNLIFFRCSDSRQSLNSQHGESATLANLEDATDCSGQTKEETPIDEDRGLFKNRFSAW
jgi:hypothetical protein